MRDFYFVVDLSSVQKIWSRITIRRIFFSVNNKREIFAEEIFVEYMRILDGYHTRAYGDAKKEKKLKEALKEASKCIKSQLFQEPNRPIFEKAIQKIITEWKFNSSNVGDISGWIASGYLSRRQLSHRLKELDRDYFEIIRNNALYIEKLPRNVHRLAGKTNDEIIELYFKELGDTRNFYSHYKQDKTGVLHFSQMNDTIKLLKATIIAIFLTHIGLEREMIRIILEFDNELNFQTMFLRKDEDKPFLHPTKWMEQHSDSEK